MERLIQNKDSKIIMQSLVAVPLLQGFLLCLEKIRKDQGKK